MTFVQVADHHCTEMVDETLISSFQELPSHHATHPHGTFRKNNAPSSNPSANRLSPMRCSKLPSLMAIIEVVSFSIQHPDTYMAFNATPCRQILLPILSNCPAKCGIFLISSVRPMTEQCSSGVKDLRILLWGLYAADIRNSYGFWSGILSSRNTSGSVPGFNGIPSCTASVFRAGVMPETGKGWSGFAGSGNVPPGCHQ